MKKQITLISGILLVIILTNLVSAVVVSDVKQEQLFPGESSPLKVEIKNTLNEDVEYVSFKLDLEKTNFISVGSSENSEDEIKEGRTETFNFLIKASQDITPGDYNIPYELSYTNSKDERIQKTGSVGLIVSAKTELEFSAETENPIVGEKGKVVLKLVNSGFSDIKFVNVKISESGFTLLGSDSDYIGTLNSDDFETSSFDVIFKNKEAKLIAIVEYKDFENNKKIESINLPLKIYSQEKAIELGLLKKNNTFIYAVVIIVLVIIYLVYRTIKKRRKLNSSNL